MLTCTFSLTDHVNCNVGNATRKIQCVNQTRSNCSVKVQNPTFVTIDLVNCSFSCVPGMIIDLCPNISQSGGRKAVLTMGASSYYVTMGGGGVSTLNFVM